jgi:REP element-mobilizing transposase RayT
MSRPNPPRRKNSLRHPRVDYRSHGAYFVTINTYRRRHQFGRIDDGVMQTSSAGDIVWEEWERTEVLRADVVLDAFVIMPDHVHGIICIVPEGVTKVSPRGHRWSSFVPAHIRTRGTHPHAPDPEGDRTSTGCSAQCRSIRAEQYDPERDGAAYRPPRSLSSIVAGFKGAVTRRVRTECNVGPDARVWHRNFHEHVLQDERHWRTVRRYIRLNPKRWWEKYGRSQRS